MFSFFNQGSESQIEFTNFFDPPFYSDLSVCYLQPMCAPNSTFPVTIRGASSVTVQQVVGCVQGLQFWCNSSSDTNDELYKVFRKGNSGREISEIIAGYDLLNSDVSIWYNSTLKNNTDNHPISLRISELIQDCFLVHFSRFFRCFSAELN
ncbi:ABC transporter A family member 8-like [Apium graveolens]|uniref:ABC transporter A family member 8-like n=1 Tax=Apium graveolens TaxID=4045 RepID=UPI003D7933BA